MGGRRGIWRGGVPTFINREWTERFETELNPLKWCREDTCSCGEWRGRGLFKFNSYISSAVKHLVAKYWRSRPKFWKNCTKNETLTTDTWLKLVGWLQYFVRWVLPLPISHSCYLFENIRLPNGGCLSRSTAIKVKDRETGEWTMGLNMWLNLFRGDFRRQVSTLSTFDAILLGFPGLSLRL